MLKNKSFFSSFMHAVKGFSDALKRERNLRFHVVIGNLICFFGAHFGITRVEWAVLLLAVCTVIVCELINSAVEKAVDTATDSIRADAMHAKDFAAAATLVSAVFAVLVGIALFADGEKIINALTAIFTSPLSVFILILLLTADMGILLINIKHNKRRNHEKRNI